MEEIYLLDIILTEGKKKEIRATRKYSSRKELLKNYGILNKIFLGMDYSHSKSKIHLLPKIILIPKKDIG